MKTINSKPMSEKTPAKNRSAGRLGRTPSIDQDSIRAAICKVGAAGEVSMQRVAKELGVNVTTLYRHTGGLDGVKRIYASHLSDQLGATPSPVGLEWRDWLLELARFYRHALSSNPDMFRFAQAALDPHFVRLEQATKILTKFGFDARAAVRAHAFLVNNVVGYVQQELQTEAEIAGGSAPTYARLSETLQQGSKHLPVLSDLQLDDADLDVDTNFEYFINYAVNGIAAQAGAPD